MTHVVKAVSVQPPRASPAGARRARPLILGLIGTIALFAIIEFVSRAGIVNSRFLPPFSTVLVEAAALLGDPAFLSDVFSTLRTWVFGLAVASLIGIPLGVLLGLSKVFYRATRPIIELVRPMPAVALIPLVLLVLGQGPEMKVFVAVYASLWPILFNTIYGVRDVDSATKDMGRIFGLSDASIIRRIVVPAAAPLIATGVRVSSTIVLIVIITVELLAGGGTGIGTFIQGRIEMGDRVVQVYAAIFIAGVLGLVLNLILGAIDRRLFAWNQTDRS